MPNPDPHPTPAENTSPVSRIVEGRPGNIEGDIDQRMASLLKDHQEMGARPADDVTVAENREQSTTTDGRNVMPASTTRAKSTRKASKPKKG